MPQVAADPLAAAFGGRDDVVVLLARLFARGAGCLTEPVGLLQQAGNLCPRFASGRRPEAHTPMAVCPELQSWASDAKADTLIQTAPIAQSPVALFASQKTQCHPVYYGDRRLADVSDPAHNARKHWSGHGFPAGLSLDHANYRPQHVPHRGARRNPASSRCIRCGPQLGSSCKCTCSKPNTGLGAGGW